MAAQGGDQLHLAEILAAKGHAPAAGRWDRHLRGHQAARNPVHEVLVGYPEYAGDLARTLVSLYVILLQMNLYKPAG